MNSEELQSLANAFHAAAEQMREPPKPHPMLANLIVDERPEQQMSRLISADVLKAIGDVYLGQAVQT